MPYAGTARSIPITISKAPAGERRSSLWDDRQSRLFTDPRALEAGDILTVTILINDRAQLATSPSAAAIPAATSACRASFTFDGGDGIGVGRRLGADRRRHAEHGPGRDPALGGHPLRVAAIVMNVLPNGNLLIRGSQEVRVNAELRILTIEGIVGPPTSAPTTRSL
jgi:flagellar L-ring protein FlgH